VKAGQEELGRRSRRRTGPVVDRSLDLVVAAHRIVRVEDHHTGLVVAGPIDPGQVARHREHSEVGTVSHPEAGSLVDILGSVVDAVHTVVAAVDSLLAAEGMESGRLEGLHSNLDLP
jgi:hypothetical protein